MFQDATLGLIFTKLSENISNEYVWLLIFIVYLVYKVLNKGVKKAPIVPNTVEEVVSTVASFIPGLNIISSLFKKK